MAEYKSGHIRDIKQYSLDQHRSVFIAGRGGFGDIGRQKKNDGDKMHAYETLYEVLSILTKLIKNSESFLSSKYLRIPNALPYL